ncbi:helix-turn-helix domain-containing protein [Streptomyces lydicus]
MSPAQWILQQRITRARHLLEGTNLPIDQVAIDAGLGSGTTLRHHMRATLGVSPGVYRKTSAMKKASSGSDARTDGSDQARRAVQRCLRTGQKDR